MRFIPQRTEPVMRQVSFLSNDSVHLRGTYWEPRTDDAIALLLVHDAGSDRTSWEPYVRTFQSRGWGVLTFDLRGHGESVRQDMRGDLLKPTPDDLRRSDTYALDTSAALAYLNRQPRTQRGRIATIGVGLGGALAYAASGRGWGTASCVMIGLAEETARALAGSGTFAPRSAYLMYGSEDPVSAASIPAFTALAGTPSESFAYPSAAYGMELWNACQPEILARSIAWIERTV
jgi:pimeloyl-ACP methyl ester carboxylesterase